MYLLAFRNGSSESFDASHVRYPIAILVIAPEAVGADVQTLQRPGGRNDIRGRTEGIFLNLPALGEEGSKHDGARSSQTLATKVGFDHRGLDGNRLAE